MIDQANLKRTILPVLKQSGVVYEKWKQVRARKAKAGEHIITITSEGVETANVADPGDYVVENQTGAREAYLVPESKFKERYKKLTDLDGEWGNYQPDGKVIAVKLTSELLTKLGSGKDFRFEAPWGSTQVVSAGDYLVSPPDFSEVYGIASREFHETYRKGD